MPPSCRARPAPSITTRASRSAPLVLRRRDRRGADVAEVAELAVVARARASAARARRRRRPRAAPRSASTASASPTRSAPNSRSSSAAGAAAVQRLEQPRAPRASGCSIRRSESVAGAQHVDVAGRALDQLHGALDARSCPCDLLAGGGARPGAAPSRAAVSSAELRDGQGRQDRLVRLLDRHSVVTSSRGSRGVDDLQLRRSRRPAPRASSPASTPCTDDALEARPREQCLHALAGEVPLAVGHARARLAAPRSAGAKHVELGDGLAARRGVRAGRIRARRTRRLRRSCTLSHGEGRPVGEQRVQVEDRAAPPGARLRCHRRERRRELVVVEQVVERVVEAGDEVEPARASGSARMSALRRARLGRLARPPRRASPPRRRTPVTLEAARAGRARSSLPVPQARSSSRSPPKPVEPASAPDVSRPQAS